MSDQRNLEDLIRSFLSDELSAAEARQLISLIQNEASREEFLEQIERRLKEFDRSVLLDVRAGDDLFAKILEATAEHKKTDQPDPKVRSIQPKWFVRFTKAAGIILLLIAGVYYSGLFQKRAETVKNETGKKTKTDDVMPGGDKAVLTLADGTVITLDDAQNGVVGKQGNSKIIKIDGKLAYNNQGQIDTALMFNTVSTPQGGQYQLELADGTKVWLNASSSIRFPAAFFGSTRQVDITGEAYFEVAKNNKMPFIVHAGGSHITVLGTHFNVFAYNDEPLLKTTLFEGSVKVSSQEKNLIITPGQQSRLAKSGGLTVVNDVDLEKEIAWKNGYFSFDGTDIESLGRQLARWYGVEIEYERKPNELFFADISRNMKLSKVLKALELTGAVRFRIEGKKVIVIQ